MTTRTITTRRRARQRARAAAAIAMAVLVAAPLSACERGGKGGSASGASDVAGEAGVAAEAPGASAFHACLTGKGVDSRIDKGTGAVALKIPKDSMPVEMQEALSSFDKSAGGSAAGGASDDLVMTMNEGGDGTGPILSAIEGQDMWSIYKDSKALAADHPDLAEPYSACEAQFPDFRQPDVEAAMKKDSEKYLADALKDTRAAAQCGHANGHSWVRDPDDKHPVLTIPSGVTEEEVRAFAKQCVPKDAMVSWGTDGELGFDLGSVIEETGGGQGFSIETGGDE